MRSEEIYNIVEYIIKKGIINIKRSQHGAILNETDVDIEEDITLSIFATQYIQLVLPITAWRKTDNYMKLNM